MSSPFTFFRRNQHVTMVGVVILAMMAFTLDAVFSQEGSHYVMLGLLMGGIIFAFVGISRGRWIQYGIGGAVLGALCGWILPAYVTSPSEIVRTSTIGVFDNKRISELMMRRSVANVFMQQAFEKSIGPGMSRFAPQFQFYSDNVEDDLTFGEIMRAEADELGIVVTDRMVSDYINKRTDEKLTAAAFAEIRTNLNLRGTVVTEEELFDSFRGEIKALMAYQQLNPHFAAVPQGPEVYYELFKRTKVSQRLNTVRLDVDAFVSEVADPSDAEVASLFAENRLKFPNMDEPGSPGFRQDRKAKLGYLELGYKAVEQATEAPTDAEIEAYYNENKDRLYRKPVETPDENSATPEGEEPKAEEPKAEEPKAEEPKAEEPKAEEPKAEEPKTEEPKTEEPKTEEPKAEEPKAEEPKAEEPKAEEPKTEEPKSEEPKAGEECSPFSDEEKPSAEEKPAADAPSEEKPAAPAEDAPPAEPAKDADAEKTETPATAADSEKPAEATATGDSTKPEFQIPKIEYQPLSDELKEEIRDRLLDEKVRKNLEEKMANIMLDLKALEKDRAKARKSVVDADRNISDEALYEKMQDYADTMEDGMKAIAKKHGCTYVETPFVTFRELNDGEAYPIGAAKDPTANPFMQAGATVAQQVFSTFPNRITDDTNLFVRHQSVKNAFDLDGGEVHFAWWIVEFSETHVPKLDDPGIRDQVVLAWKRAKARDLAKKRAEELAELVKSENAKPEADRKNFSAVLEGQTVLGEKESAGLTVRQTQTFSWMEQQMTPQMNFMQQQPPRLSEVRFTDAVGGSIRGAGPKFMESVFQDLANEEVGVVATDDLAAFFVAQPVERSEDDEILRQQFLTESKQFGFRNGAVAQMLASEVSNPASLAWERRIWTKYGVDRDTLPEE
jgi:hypothetical protein